MPYYERQPYIQPLHQLLNEVLSGEIRVPRFQRPGTELTWKPQQRGDLLDSLYRGFPVGTILLWSTTESIKTVDRIGGFDVPPVEAATRPLRLLLDGHQRLSTLVYVLGPALRERAASQDSVEQWFFDLHEPKDDARARDRFVLLKPGEDPTSEQLPLEIILSRTELNKWLRSRTDLDDDAIKLADGLRDRMREYAMPVAVLSTDSLDEATESFKRVNSSGTPMGDVNMVAALVYTDDFNLPDVLFRARANQLSEMGWEDTNDSDILRVCAGLIRSRARKGVPQHPAKLDIGALARTVRREQKLVEDAVVAIALAARSLAQCGIHGPAALPYSYQLITLAVYLGSPDPVAESEEREQAISDWFWITTYGGVFAGVNSAVYDRALRGLSKIAAAQNTSVAVREMERDVARSVVEVERYDFRSARAKACVLNMARLQDGDRVDGAAHQALAAQGASAVRNLHTPRRGLAWYHRVVNEGQTFLRDVRDALRQRANGDPMANGLQKIGIPDDAQGDLHELLAARRALLLARERQFIERLGLRAGWATVDDG